MLDVLKECGGDFISIIEKDEARHFPVKCAAIE
jgi:hypothetical protein